MKKNLNNKKNKKNNNSSTTKNSGKIVTINSQFSSQNFINTKFLENCHFMKSMIEYPSTN